MQRVDIPELLDRDDGDPAEVARSLADLRLINRWFGGFHTTTALMRRVAELTSRPTLSLLDVAAGSGDVALAAQRGIAGRGVRLEVTLFDRKPWHLKSGNGVSSAAPLERRHLPRSSSSTGIRYVVGDALALPFCDNSFDVVSCSLFAHHLPPEHVIAFARQALRVCRTAVIINDLRRTLALLALVYAGFPLMRSYMSRHDGVASARRAYTIDEMREMLSHTGAARVEITRQYLQRMGVVAWKEWPVR